MSDDFTPTRVIRENYRWLPAVIIVSLTVLGVGLLLTLIGWRVGWWFTQQNVNRQGQVIQQGYSNQTSQVARMQQAVSEVDTITSQIAQGGDRAALAPQRAAIAGEACNAWSQLTATFRATSGEASWAGRNCSGGVLSTGSPYYTTGG